MDTSILRKRLAEVKKAIAQQHQISEELLDQEKVIQLQLDNTIYPILTIPPEITCKIFIQCVPSKAGNHHPTLAPLLLLRVCSAWRTIALSTPSLWSTLHLDMTQRSTVPNRQALENRIRSWLEYAGGCPLSLTLRGWNFSTWGPCPFPAIITRYASQLRHLDAKMRPANFRLRDIAEFPLLQTLTIHCFTHPSDVTLNDHTPITAWRTAPKLLEITFERQCNRFLHPECLPWNRLTTINCTVRLKADECLAMVRWAPLLIRLVISPCSTSVNRPLFSHSRLESLTISRHGNPDILRFLGVPILRSLRLLYWRDLTDESFIPFLSRSPALRMLTCHTSRRSLKALRTLTQLTDLELFETPYVDDHEQLSTAALFMLDREREPDTLPHLKSVTLSNWGKEVDERVIQALHSRRVAQEGGAKLQAFRAFHENQPMRINEDQIPHLRRFVAEGMKIHIGSNAVNLL
ncbi:hypothetical protein DFH07DRAFT_1066719 [Mycena maculata]|uniref:F-box domain-containing protein n=1 Tax=Mycena maculata TaxID=230809 RepID=A0AAD7MPL5_9AGAR|nr:hypothetical protein DFH07DRAFT_1066719 [Mycena maculata]